jgi:hypothetical protein
MHHESEWGPRPERECGDEVHILGKKVEPVWPFLDGLDLSRNVNLGKRDRIYIIWSENQKMKGQFLFGKRKSAPWVGFGSQEPQVDEEAYNIH